MTRQIEFFMTPTDEHAFVTFVQQTCDLRVFRQSAADATSLLVGAWLPTEETLVSLTCAQFADRIKRSHVSATNRYYIDFMNSEVIQFTRCVSADEGKSLIEGRLWFDPRTAGGEKSRDFVTWAGKVFAYLRRTYKRNEQGFYVGPDASEAANAGRIFLGAQTAPIGRDEALRKLGLK